MMMDAGAPPIRVKPYFTKNIAFMIKEAVWHPSQEIEDTEDGGCLLTVTVNDLAEIKLWIRTWGPEVRVLAPESLRLEVARDSEKVCALYGHLDLDSEQAHAR
jgi:predicted DNA-binding transcriptional regulator YafY